MLKRCLIAGVAVVLVAILLAAWEMHEARRSVPVLSYHQVNDIDENTLTIRTQDFEDQMRCLEESGYHAITPDEMLDAWENGTDLPENPVIITFDDGYVDNFKNVFPVLEKHHMKATIFLVTDYIGFYPNYLTWDMAREMQDSGLVTFGSHTLSHAVLTDMLSPEDVRYQLMASKQAMEWHLQRPAKYIAYPCGAFNPSVMELTQNAGYRAAFTVHYGMADPDESRFILDRIPIFRANRLSLLRFRIRVAYAPLLAPVNQLRDQLLEDGYTAIASLIPVP